MNVVDDVIESNQYKKNRKKMAKRGRNMSKLESTIELIKTYQTSHLKDLHPITKGKYARNMDCHVEGDWILIWRYEDSELPPTKAGGFH